MSNSTPPADPRTPRERRRSPRFPVRAPLELEWGSAVLRAHVRDISFEGMFIEMPDPLWLGAGFSARVEFETPVRLDCTVRRVEPAKGIGVTYVPPDAESRARLRALLETLDKR